MSVSGAFGVVGAVSTPFINTRAHVWGEWVKTTPTPPNTPAKPLSDALAEINAAFAPLTLGAVNAALLSGEQDRIVPEVREWRRQQLDAIAEVSR